MRGRGRAIAAQWSATLALILNKLALLRKISPKQSRFLPPLPSLELHLHRIQPNSLLQKINRGEKLLIFDLLHYEEGTEGAEGVPTSVRLDPSRIREAHHVLFPSDLNVVLYCASPNHFRSSRVALALKRRGVQKIAVLASGLKAWREQGLPTTHDFLSPEEVILRYKIQMI